MRQSEITDFHKEPDNCQKAMIDVIVSEKTLSLKELIEKMQEKGFHVRDVLRNILDYTVSGSGDRFPYFSFCEDIEMRLHPDAKCAEDDQAVALNTISSGYIPLPNFHYKPSGAYTKHPELMPAPEWMEMIDKKGQQRVI